MKKYNSLIYRTVEDENERSKTQMDLLSQSSFEHPANIYSSKYIDNTAFKLTGAKPRLFNDSSSSSLKKINYNNSLNELQELEDFVQGRN